MKYPVGTKCWVVNVHNVFALDLKGRTVTVIDHELEAYVGACSSCGTREHVVECDLCWGCCVCTLVPIDDPDAAEATRASEELPEAVS